MKFRLVVYPSEEGSAVSVPSLTRLWSQGATTEEALENIAIAIHGVSRVRNPIPM